MINFQKEKIFDQEENFISVKRSFLYDDPTLIENIVKAEFEMENELYYFEIFQ